VAGIVQFNPYTPARLSNINGEAIGRGENIADLGGIVIGLDAFKTKQYKEGKR
jgi:putative endopeptidase